MDAIIAKLLEISSDALAHSAGEIDTAVPESIGRDRSTLIEILEYKNGFFCFESALHVFPSLSVETSWGLIDWNSSSLWKSDYQGFANDIFCFAEDIFCTQFCMSSAGIFTFNPETADREQIAGSLREWAEQMLVDYNQLTGYRFAHEWQQQNGPVPARYRLMPKIPFVLGGEYALNNLAALDGVRVMKNLGNLASQIHHLPDGAHIEFKII
jgi:hypothetical protein